MIIPAEFKTILDKSSGLVATVSETISVYKNILEENKLFFFEEYTDHGIKHINSVLEFSSKLIRKRTYAILEKSPRSIAWYVLSVILHDLGMHLTNEGFYLLLNGKNDDIKIAEFDKKTWKQLWEEFLHKASRYSDKEKENIFGDPEWSFRVPPIENRDKLTGEDRKLIGEFIRIHHPRIAHEIAINGFPAPGGNIPFAPDLRPAERFLCGLVARSHGMGIRDTFDYIKKKFPDTWTRPYGTELFFLMVVLRIADYCQIDADRINPVTLKLKSFHSPISKNEHYTHEDLPYLQQSSIDPETLAFHCEPRNSFIFIKIKKLLSGLQNELDRSWAILGEVYGKDPKEDQPEIKYRRIKANIDDVDTFAEGVSYIPQQINFTIANELSKLLIAPLYGNDPSYGVRELIQNAVDSCIQRAILEEDGYEGKIIITFYKKDDQTYFRIEDNGTGMSLDTLTNYYLRVGSSYRLSAQWKHDFSDKNGKSKVPRTGKFGIGVLAMFLLGKKIHLQTKAMNASHGLSFETNLENKHIEITKSEKQHIGTIIEIPIEPKIVSMLNVDSGVRFDKWFVNASPKIVYDDQINVFKGLGYNKHLPGYHDVLPPGWYQMPTQEYNKILWAYNLPEYVNGRDLGYNNHQNLDINLNGIFIPNIAKLIDQQMVISVFDFEGKFPINLNRNGLDGSLPFKNQLIEEMVKKSFASIIFNSMTTPFSNLSAEKIMDTRIIDPILGHATLFLSKTGYIVASDYFIEKNKTRLLLSSQLSYCKDLLSSVDLGNAFIEILIISSFKNWAELNASRHYNVVIRGGSVSQPTNNVKEIVHTSPISISNIDKNTIKVKRSYKQSSFNEGTLLNILEKKTGPNEVFIIESTLEDYQLLIPPLHKRRNDNNNFAEIFNAIVSRYMNGASEIPYDFEERKRLFPEAFEELKQFIRDK